MWIYADYLPTALFSLRPANATTSGGKSLLAPTPFALKMALLDVAIRTQGLDAAQELFPDIRRLRIGLRLPEQIAVNHTFIKILRIKEIKTKASEKEAAIAQAQADRQWPFQNTIAYREYVHFGGPLTLAFQGMREEDLTALLPQINYLGKRGGFMQWQGIWVGGEELDAGYTELTADIGEIFPLGTLQMMDDFGPNLNFEQADIFSSKRITLGKDRILRHVVLPCRAVRSSRGFTLYRRNNGGDDQ